MPSYKFGDNSHVEAGGDVNIGSGGDGGGGFSGWLALVSAAVVAGLIVAFLVAAISGGDDHQRGPATAAVSDSTSAAAVSGGITVTVDNRIPIGRSRMSEDKPLRLFTTAAICRDETCVVPGTSYNSGDRISHTVCQTRGDWVTNQNMNTHADDANSGVASSSLWYGVRQSNGHLAFVSVVWLARGQRDGRSLPDCRTQAFQR
ncbi:MAG: putative thiopeptide-lantipeptide biosynthesis related protein [Conexibacter sp.]|nr:putative thiopeptide-lantipeptide biosynthesis related protein [Conexibacter sp.]